jgi:invasion protein IalB
MGIVRGLVHRLIVRGLLTTLAPSLVTSEVAAQVPMVPDDAAPQTLLTPEELIYSPWTKLCRKGQDAKQVCFTSKVGRLRNGIAAVTAILMEQEDRPKKILRVTLPLGMSIQPGTRVIVDRGQPMTGAYVICFANGCIADYEASEELIGTLKMGRDLVVQGVRGTGQAVSLVLPLTDFAKAFEGPPTDPAFEVPHRQTPKPWQDDTLQPHLRPRAK